MKRSILTLLLLSITCSLFASLPSIQERLTNDSYRGENLNYIFSGRSNLSSFYGIDAFSSNPASLGRDPYFLSISLNGSIYNIRRILQSDFVQNFNTLTSEGAEVLLDSALGLLSTFSGRSPFVTLDEHIAFGLGGFATGIFLRERLLTSGESFGTNAILALDLKGSIGYGRRFMLGDNYALSAGLILSLRGKVYTEDIGAEAVTALALNKDTSEEYALFSGISLSADAGLHAEFPNSFGLSFAIRDITEGYKMTTHNDSAKRFASSFIIETPLSFDISTSWAPKSKYISARFEVGLERVNYMLFHLSKENFLLSLHAGASITIWDFITLTGGLYQGYPAFGLGLKLLCFDTKLGYAVEDRGTSFALRSSERFLFSLSLSL